MLCNNIILKKNYMSCCYRFKIYFINDKYFYDLINIVLNDIMF